MKLSVLANFLLHPRRQVLRPNFSAFEPPIFFYLVFLFFTVSFYTQLGARLEFLGAIRHELLLGFLLLGMCTLVLMSRPPELAQEATLLWIVGCFVLVHVIQIPFAVDPNAARTTFMTWVIKHIMLCGFIIILVRSPRLLFGFIAAFVFSLFWVYQEAVRGLISGSLMWYNQGILRLHGAVPLYFHPNGLSLAACQSLPFIFFALPLLRRWFLPTMFLLATLGLSALCIINTGSRAGYVGCLAMIPYWILDGPGKLKRLFIAVGIAAVLLPVFPEQYKGRFESITGTEVKGRSREARLQILYDAWEVWKMYPFGTGIEGFQVVRAQVFGRSQDTHNLYAQVLTHLGIQAFIVFAAFVVALFRSLNRSIARLKAVRRAVAAVVSRDRDPGLRRGLAGFDFEVQSTEAIARAAKLLLYFLLVNGLFAHTLYHVVWWFLTGLTIAIGGITFRMHSGALARCRVHFAGLQDTPLEPAPAP